MWLSCGLFGVKSVLSFKNTPVCVCFDFLPLHTSACNREGKLCRKKHHFFPTHFSLLLSPKSFIHSVSCPEKTRLDSFLLLLPVCSSQAQSHSLNLEDPHWQIIFPASGSAVGSDSDPRRGFYGTWEHRPPADQPRGFTQHEQCGEFRKFIFSLFLLHLSFYFSESVHAAWRWSSTIIFR